MHELEMRADGTAKMFYVGETPWHGLGTRFETAPATAAAAMAAADQDYTVSKRPVRYYGGNALLEFAGQYVVARDTDDKPFAVVAEDYEPFQPRDAFGFMDPFVADGSAAFETAGSLYGGAALWVLVKLAKPIQILPKDTVRPYLILRTSHDQRYSVGIRFTVIRGVCQNTVSAAFLGDAGRDMAVSIRHTRNVAARVAEVGMAMRAALDAARLMGEAFQKMAQTKLTAARAIELTTVLLPDNPDAKNHARTRNMRAEILTEMDHGPGSDIPGVRGSVWGWLNGATRWADHVRGLGGRRALDETAASNRLNGVWFGAGDELKTQAAKLALAECGS